MESGIPASQPFDAGSIFTTNDLPLWSRLPPQPTRLIDREDELARLGALLTEEEIRLLTLTGPGGVGKTRLGIAAAEQGHERFPDGVWFVGLAPLADFALVVPTMARVTGVHEQPGRAPLKALTAFLRDRSVLVVLDNFEHVLDAVPALDALLADCPALTILATSREPLRLRRERVADPSLPRQVGNLPHGGSAPRLLSASRAKTALRSSSRVSPAGVDTDTAYSGSIPEDHDPGV